MVPFCQCRESLRLHDCLPPLPALKFRLFECSVPVASTHHANESGLDVYVEVVLRQKQTPQGTPLWCVSYVLSRVF
jgi:hypothetical protein